MTSDEIIRISNKEKISTEELILCHCPENYGYETHNHPMDTWNPCDIHDIIHCSMCWGRSTKIKNN